MEFIKVENLVKTYQMGENTINALNDLSFSINSGEFTVILGPSGSGKSTLLNILGGMDVPTSGTVIVGENEISKFSAKQLNEYRRVDIGFVFQFYNLLPNLTAKENVDVSRKVSSDPLDSKTALAQVGLENRSKHFPSELSGGEQQRVSIARAICKNPKLLLCDEPTGALDSETGKLVLTTLHNMCKQYGHSVVIVTHNQSICPAADSVINIKDGKVVKISKNEHPIMMDKVIW